MKLINFIKIMLRNNIDKKVDYVYMQSGSALALGLPRRPLRSTQPTEVLRDLRERRFFPLRFLLRDL